MYTHKTANPALYFQYNHHFLYNFSIKISLKLFKNYGCPNLPRDVVCWSCKKATRRERLSLCMVCLTDVMYFYCNGKIIQMINSFYFFFFVKINIVTCLIQFVRTVLLFLLLWGLWVLSGYLLLQLWLNSSQEWKIICMYYINFCVFPEMEFCARFFGLVTH